MIMALSRFNSSAFCLEAKMLENIQIAKKHMAEMKPIFFHTTRLPKINKAHIKIVKIKVTIPV